MVVDTEVPGKQGLAELGEEVGIEGAGKQVEEVDKLLVLDGKQVVGLDKVEEPVQVLDKLVVLGKQVVPEQELDKQGAVDKQGVPEQELDKQGVPEQELDKQGVPEQEPDKMVGVVLEEVLGMQEVGEPDRKEGVEVVPQLEAK